MDGPITLPAEVEIAVAAPGDADAFWRANERAWRSEMWAFKVVWHERSHEIVARVDGEIAGALRATIAASLARIDALYVREPQRRRGVGRALLTRCEELANYYNCHKMTVGVMQSGPAQTFFEACGYHVEAVLPQHTFKLDVAMLRKFLL
jgi:GNAT superfamily N-acetyltransferase